MRIVLLGDDIWVCANGHRRENDCRPGPQRVHRKDVGDERERQNGMAMIASIADQFAIDERQSQGEQSGPTAAAIRSRSLLAALGIGSAVIANKMPSSGEITNGLRKTVPANWAATRNVDEPDARVPSKTAMPPQMNTIVMLRAATIVGSAPSGP